MAEQRKANSKTYAFLENRTIEELEKLLELAMQDPEPDTAYLAALEAAILRRETEHPSGRLADPDRAWETFRNVYLDGEMDWSGLSEEIEVPPLTYGESSRRPRKSRRIGRTLLIAAVVVIMMTLLLPPVMGYQNVFQLVARWTDEQFKFVLPGYETSEAMTEGSDKRTATPPLTKMMESMESHNLPSSLAPTWIPEDRTIFQAKFNKRENGKSQFKAIFSDENNDHVIIFNLIKYPQNDGPQTSSITYEKDDGEVIEFSCNGITHYIMTNNETVNIVWYVAPFEVSISGNISVDEAKKIIESIYAPVTPGLKGSLEEHDLPTSLAPTWFPEGRYLSEMQYNKYDDGTMFFSAAFVDENSENPFYFDLTLNSQPGSSTWEKDDNPVTEYICDGVTHYIMTNDDCVSAVWYSDPYKVSISGHITKAEAKAMIKSIYGPEAFVQESEKPQDTGSVTQLTESMEEHGFPTSFAPSWFPEDRQLSDIQYSSFEDREETLTAIFVDKNEENVIFYKISKNVKPGTGTWEKDDRPVIEFVCTGITHYIMTNNKTVSAVWYSAPFEVAVYGHITIEQAKTIIESIYENE